MESLDISDIGLGPKGCSEELQEAMISNGRLLQLNIRWRLVHYPSINCLSLGEWVLADIMTSQHDACPNI